MNPSASFPDRMAQTQSGSQPYLNAQQAREPVRRPSPTQRPFQPSHSYSQSTSVLLNSGRQMPTQQQQQQQQPGSNRNGSMRPMSAYQPLDNPEYQSAAASGPLRPTSPAGSVARSTRSAQAPLTFKSQDLRSALSLQEAQQKKLYMEGYLLKRDDLGTDGKALHAGDPKRQWTECFVQLSGTVLSMWNVEKMEEAARQGTEVAPTYINITDSFVDFIGLLVEDPQQIPGSRGRYHHAFAINSAGNNRTLFCFRDPPPFPPDLIEQWLAPEHRQKSEHKVVIGWLNLGHRHLQAWINAIRLASWEKVRLEEIYTGALVRARLGGAPSEQAQITTPGAAVGPIVKSTLVKGKMEGWVKARFMGTTEWKKVWLVLSDHKTDEAEAGTKKKFWKLGGAGDRSSIMSSNSGKGAVSPGPPGIADLPPPPGGNGAPGIANFFETKKAKKPFASLIYGAHAFAVYPSRPELVEGSSLFKVEGVFPSSSVLSATNRVRTTGWVMLMPELDGAGSRGANAEMMKWIIAFMDSFKLYGRPDNIIWEARDPISPFFAYPIGPFKERLFLDRELAEFLEIAREDHLTTRSSLHGIMSARMRGERTKILQPLPPPSQAESSQRGGAAFNTSTSQAAQPSNDASYNNQKLPPLDFASAQDRPAALNEARNDSAPLRSPASYGQNGLDAAPREIDFANQANNGPSRGISPTYESIKPAQQAVTGFALSRDSHSAQSRGSDMQPGTSAPITASRILPATPQIQPPQESRDSVGLNVHRPQDQHTPRAAPSATEQMKPTPPVSVGRLSPANEGLPAYPSSSTNPMLATSNANTGSAGPPTLGPSGRGAEADTVNKRSSVVPSNYDESALFYMASMSDQLPDTKPVSTSARAPDQVQQAPPSSQTSQSQGLAPSSNPTSAVPSENNHPNKISVDSTPLSRSSLMAKTDAVPAVRSSAGHEDSINDDALAAYSFLDQPHSPVVQHTPAGNSWNSRQPAAAPIRTMTSESTPNAEQPATAAVSEQPASTLRPVGVQYPSTFGQNKRSMERKTAAQLQAQAHQEALSRPGRAAGNKTKGTRNAGWTDDSDEDDEDEDDEEDDDEDASCEAPVRRPVQPAASSTRGTESPVKPLSDSVASLGRSQESVGASQGQRMLPPSNSASGQNTIGRISDYNTQQGSMSPVRAGQAHPSMQSSNRQSMFNTHLNAAHGDDMHSNSPPQSVGTRDRQTFLQLNPDEQPGAMTTVFTPHGLVQAGAQDKTDRSAKTQEATARALGSNLVNVPNKPPPPQAGLLGAITAHERDRKGAGGLGATLTERERERVTAERRQREEDAAGQQQQLQMQQLQQQQMQQMAYFNPMMYQQMMMGGMGGMGGMMPGMMGMGMSHMGGFGGSQMGGAGGSQIGGGGFDPMMAQQQAMQAAQMAYMNAMSQAHQEGSVMGHGSVSGNHTPMGNMGMPPSMGNMGMPPSMGSMQFNPHMSMMGNPYGGFMGGMGGMGSPLSEFGMNTPSRPTSARPGQSGQTGERD